MPLKREVSLMWAMAAVVLCACARSPTTETTSLATPISFPGSSGGPMQSGVPWPASFRPYGAISPWNRPISNQSKPRLIANSDSIIAHAMPTDADGQQLRVFDIDLEDGLRYHDDGHPWFVALRSDPIVQVKCRTYCDFKVSSMRIPPRARPGNGGDSHISVIQPDGQEIDTWLTTWPLSDWAAGSTLTASTVTKCGDFYTGAARLEAGYTSDVGNSCLQAGTVNFNEAFSGIHHALFLYVGCGTPATYRYPAQQQFDVPCTDGEPSFANGDHIWSDLTDSQVNALVGLTGTANDVIWQKNVLIALHRFGGYISDSAGSQQSHAGAPQILLEDSGSYTALGIEAPWQTYAKANGWTLSVFGTAHVWQFADPWNPLDDAHVGGWRAHLHIIDPCYAKGSC